MRYLKSKEMREKYFDITRFGFLLKLELYRSVRAALIAYVVIFGLLFFVGFLPKIIFSRNEGTFAHDYNYVIALIIGGFFLSSLAFRDLTSTLRRYHYLTMPASSLEKFVSMWLLTSLGWLLSFTLIYTVYTWAANGIGTVLFSRITFLRFDPLEGIPLRAMKHYFIWQGVFLAGAVHFKGNVFPKTLFTLVIAALVLVGCTFLIMGDLFFSEHVCNDEYCEIVEKIGFHPLWSAIEIFFWWMLAPLCWGITYLGLKEKEV